MKLPEKKFPHVSVIIPVFNGEETIEECIRGVLDSDYSSFEIIVVDDGSSDQTPQIVKSFNQVKLLRQKNSGSAAAKNLGAKNANGDYLYFLDSDVIIFKNTISKLIGTAITYEVDMVVGRYSTEPLNNRLTHHYKAIMDYVQYIPKKFRNEVKINHQMGGGGDLFSKKAFIEVGEFNEKYGGASVEREEFYIRFYSAGFRSAANPDIKTRHYFPDFKVMIKNYIFRIYETVKLLDGKKNTNFSYISFEKAILSPVFAFILTAAILFSLFGILPSSAPVICTFLFFGASWDFIRECQIRKGVSKMVLLIGIHYVVCIIIFVAGSLSTLIIKLIPTKQVIK
jgi:glycosyltransferase involved in cell wall biosynthesis